MTVSSGTGFHPVPYAATYSSTKAAVNWFTEGLQAELPGVDVMLLTPGFTKTPMVRGFTAFGLAETA